MIFCKTWQHILAECHLVNKSIPVLGQYAAEMTSSILFYFLKPEWSQIYHLEMIKLISRHALNVLIVLADNLGSFWKYTDVCLKKNQKKNFPICLILYLV